MNIPKTITQKIGLIKKSEVAIRVLHNSSWIMSDKIFTMVIGVFVTALVTRYFGPSEYGQFNYALSFVSLFTAISTLGLETLTVRSIINNDYDEGTILCTSLILRAAGGIILTIIAGIIIRIIEPNDRNIHVLVTIMSFTMLLKSLEVVEYWIQAHQKAKISSIIRMSAYVISASLKALLVYSQGSLLQYAFIYSIDALIIGTSLIIAYFKFRENNVKWRINFEYAKHILSQSWYLILSGLLVTLYMQIDKIMLGNMMTTKIEVGIYSAASQVAQMWYFIPMAIITSMQPVIMKKKQENEEAYLNSVQLLYRIIAWIGIIFGIFIVVFSDLIINILYGAQYIKASSILSISIWAGTFATLGSARGVWLVTENLQRFSLIYIGSGAVVNVLLNYILIPIMGGYGAAIATLIAQIVVVILVPLLIKETRLSAKMILKALVFKK